MKRVLAAVAMGAALGACTPDFVTQDESEVILRIAQITGLAGEQQEEGDNALLSDVFPMFNDIARMRIQAIAKNPSVNEPGSFQDVRIERYEVRYIRSDGRGTEGVDVPYRITGNISQTVPFGDEAEVLIDVVRHQAKAEPPLRNLRGQGDFLNPGSPVFGGGALFITLFGEITLHGRTTTGAAVSASGRLQITFADFADDN